MNAAEIRNGQVVRAIKGTVEWAAANLGGTWVDCGDAKPGAGWTYVDGEFRWPQPYPSWSWQDGDWVAPVTYPGPSDDGSWMWDEDAQEWTFLPKTADPDVP